MIVLKVLGALAGIAVVGYGLLYWILNKVLNWKGWIQ